LGGGVVLAFNIRIAVGRMPVLSSLSFGSRGCTNQCCVLRMCWSSAKSTCSPTLIANAVHHVTGFHVRDLPIALAMMLR
jgi:hypothetical protein